jgi:hypothetical protein
MGLQEIVNPEAYKEAFLKRERRFCVFGAICGYKKQNAFDLDYLGGAAPNPPGFYAWMPIPRF